MNVGGTVYGNTPGSALIVYDWQLLLPALLAYTTKQPPAKSGWVREIGD